MQETLPESIAEFQQHYPEVAEAFAALGKKCHEAGPLDEKTRRLVKLGIAIGHRHQGAVHSAVRNALRSGVSAEELFHVALLAVTTCGWPAAFAAITWIDDQLARADGAKKTQPIESKEF